MKNRSVKVLLLAIGVVIVSLSIVTPTWATFYTGFRSLGWGDFNIDSVLSSQPNPTYEGGGGALWFGQALPDGCPYGFHVLDDAEWAPTREGLWRLDVGRYAMGHSMNFHDGPIVPGTGIDSIELTLYSTLFDIYVWDSEDPDFGESGEDIYLEFPMTLSFMETAPGVFDVIWPSSWPSQTFWYHGIEYVATVLEGGWNAKIELAPVPEPTTMLLIGSGLAGLWGARKKFRK